MMMDPSGLIAVDIQDLEMHHTKMEFVPGGKCGATLQDRKFNGNCGDDECNPGGYKPVLSVSYRPQMWIAIDAPVPPDVIAEHEQKHYEDGLENVQIAIAKGVALEGRTFSSKVSCEYAISVWRQQSEARFYYSRSRVHFWAALSGERSCD